MNRFFHILISFFLLSLLAECAKIGSPSGGPRDETPPRVVKSKPLNHSVEFHGNKIEITFDEFIRTDAIGQELLVSPPFEERPEIRLKGKTLVIEWEEELHDSTTYTFSFGESLKDLNEGNVLLNYEFVFSTGSHLDSLSVIGTVLQAFDLKPSEEKIYLMLHENLRDSAPLLQVPDYVGRADADGNFLVNNVKPGNYRLFALGDLNRNFKYDVPEEYIGFLDSVICLSPSIFDSLLTPAVDTLRTGFPDSLYRTDSLSGPLDDSVLSLTEERIFLDTTEFGMADSMLVEGKDTLTLADLAPWSIFVDVFIFREDNTPQYLIENARKDRRKLSLRFNRRVTDTVILEPLDFEPGGDWYLFEEHVMNDTFVYWINDSLVYQRDSLTIGATYQVTDSLLNYIPFHDTLRFYYRDPVKKSSRRKREKEEEVAEETETIGVSIQVQGGSEQDLNKALVLEVQHPVADLDTSRISLFKRVDTVKVREPYSLIHDDFKLRRYFLKVDWEGLSSYELNLYPGAFRDIYGLTHDTISKVVKARDPEYYGRILLNLEGVCGPLLIQVLDNKGLPVRQSRVDSDGPVEFDFMPPSAFTLKLIHDGNENGKWDTGDYLEHRQPERVEFYQDKITVRSNFDMEVNWNLESPPSGENE